MLNFESQITSVAALVACICTVLTVAQDPCANHINMYRSENNRSSFFTVSYSNVLCDNNIDPNQWVSFYGPGEQSFGYKIPEICIVPYHCGTLLPIWINGYHPNTSNPGPLELEACHSSYDVPDCCGYSARIQVKWCSPGYYVYKLQPPETCYSAYCFNNVGWLPGPPYPSLSNPVIRDPFISDFKPVNWSLQRTDGTYGLYTFNATKFSIGCSVMFANGFKPGNSSLLDSLVVEVDFVVVEGQNIRSLLPQPFIHRTATTKEYLIGEEYIAGNLDKPVMCSAKSYWSNQPGFHSPILYSRQITLELQIKTNPPRHVAEDRIIILDERDSLQLRLQPNFPVTFGHCFEQGVICKPYQFPIISGFGVNALSPNCVINIYPHVIFPVNVVHPESIITISAPQTLGTRSAPFSVEIDFLPIALFPANNSIFNYQYKIPSIFITITDTQKRQTCSTSGDPHIITFKYNGTVGLPYAYHMMTELGDFYLVTLKNPSRVFEIQVQHRPCAGWPTNPSQIKCNCGVFIREGNNVVGINHCGNTGFVPLIVKYQTVTHDSNGYKIPSPLLEEKATDQWQVTLLSGVLVYIINGRGNLHILVTGLAHEEYGGLCAPGTTEATALQYRVPAAKSLFNHLADCVDEDIPISRCNCVKNSTTNSLVYQVCKTTEPVTTLTVQTQCNKNVTVTGPITGVQPTLAHDAYDPYSIVVPADMVQSPIAPGISTTPVNNKWPTPNKGITESQAVSKCQSVFEKSPAYSRCAQNSTNLLDSCVIDIQVSENLDIADIYLSPFNLQCLHEVESSIVENVDGTSVNGTDKLLQEIKSVLCPADCTYKNETRGVCVNGTCQCYNGFKGMDCSIKIGDPPTIIDFYQDVIDYTSDNSTTKDGVLIFIAAENVDYVNETEISCRFTINSAIGSDIQKIEMTYPGVRMLGGLVACFIKPNESLTGALYHVNVSLSNDGAIYSNEKSMIVHDGNCTQCTNSSDCSVTDGKCTVGGVCSEDPGRMEGCDQTTSIDVMMTTETAQDTATTPKDECQWISYYNQHSWYGNLKHGISTLDECRKVCCEDSTCVAVDFDTNAAADRCWFHTDITLVDSTRESYGGVLQTVKQLCRKCDSISWTTYPNKNSFGATKYDQFQTADSCKSFCECKENCEGVDYDRIQNACWIHTNSDAINTKYYSSDVDQYIVQCVVPVECYRWDTLNKTQSVGAQFYPNFQTLSSCLKHCEELPDCVAADINTGSSTIWCYLHLNKQQADNTRRSATGVDQYVLRRCQSDSCTSLWLPYPGSQSYGGSKLNGVNTTDACRTACEGLSGCVAVDFDLTDNSCWSQSDPSVLTHNRIGNSNINQFRLLRSRNCRDDVTWELNPGFHSSGAQRADSVTTADDCKNLCRNDLTCVAVDFNRANTPNKCWVHRNSNNIITKYPDSNIDQYVIKRS